jgi:glycosyltransferase involved in cell wall biosynthesis
MAQAMYLGKPVIATNYSGNLEFMNAETALLVNYKMTELGEDAGSYERGTRWADPDVDHAASLMRWVYENRGEADAIGARAATHVRTVLDPPKPIAEIIKRVRKPD